ncbi:MAG: hypothetical protein H7250_01565 [Flavobacterium sp.]|nr:hypothetical protein [Flavobacterium sp.]
MKSIFSLILVLLFLNSCDDGNINVISFDFSTAKAQSCNMGISGKFFVFSKKDQRTFIIQTSELNFANEVTPADSPRIILINGTTSKVIYREYSDKIADNTICTAIPPVSPVVTKELNAIGGSIVIITTPITSENATDGSSRITNYNHEIYFQNIRFNNGDSEQTNDKIAFGTYTTAATTPVNFSDLSVKNCSTTGNYLFKTSGNQALNLVVDATIFDTTILGTPKTKLIDGTNNKLNYSVYTNNVNQDILCSATAPLLSEIWEANNSTDISGIKTGVIEVITNSIGNGQFQHTIRLKNVTLTKGNVSFRLGTDYLFGDYTP